MVILERLAARGFAPLPPTLYANALGVRKGQCAALLEPLPGGRFRLLGEASWLVEGNLTVRVFRDGRWWFVWKKQKLEATPERLMELSTFAEELKLLTEPRA